MDRLDWRLTAQRGWRRLLIGWLVFVPVFLDAGLLWSGSGNLDDQATVPAGSVLPRVAIAALAGIPLAAVLVWLLMRRRKSRPWEPVFSWRMIAGLYVFMTGACAAAYGDTRTLAWRRQHLLPLRALLLLDALAGALYVWNALYCRKLRRQAEAGAQTAAS
ncbi:MAG TPA: hypothetical protein VMI73_24705 [Trebonia sp.]|nr:hypothetical protein [Trebonia sp.]